MNRLTDQRMPRAPRPTPRGPRAGARHAGFTLVELVIATTIGAMLLVAVAEVAQLFGKEVEVVRDESDWRLQESLVRMADDTKRAWYVEVPETDVLQLTDAYGNVTRYEHDADAKTLTVLRPSGATGTVLTGIESFTVDARTIERYREGTTLDTYDTWWVDDTSLGGASEAIPVEDGLPLALGFTLDTTAPDWVHTLDGVTEQNELATLERLVLPLAFVPPVAEGSSSSGGSSGSDDSGIGTSSFAGPDASDGGDSSAFGDCDDGGKGGSSGKGKGGSSGKGKGSSGCGKGSSGGCGDDSCDDSDCSDDGSSGGSSKKAEICHIPPGNPDNAKTLSVSVNAVAAHLAHGDSEGACGTSVAGPDPADSVLYLDLYEAATPGDGRPYGALLGSTSVPASALPSGTWSWVSKGTSSAATHGGGSGGKGVAVCHIPPGNPSAAHTIHVGASAVSAHVAHGDVLGSCDDSLDADSTLVLQYDAPLVDVPLDLTPLNGLIQPGRAHTLVLRVAGSGTVVVAGQPVGSDAHTGIASVNVPGGAYSALDLTVPRSLDGMRSASQTVKHDVINGVTLTLQTVDGERSSASAAVASQVAVDNPWLGCVPGEFPGLELAGQ